MPISALTAEGAQDKVTRTVVLTWLWQSINAYLVRFATTAPKDRLFKWLEKCIKPVLVALKKGSFTQGSQMVSITTHNIGPGCLFWRQQARHLNGADLTGWVVTAMKAMLNPSRLFCSSFACLMSNEIWLRN